MSKEKLERLAARLKSGDKEAFDGIYAETYGAVYSSAFSVLKDRMRAEDVTQDTFVTVYRRIDSYREGTNFFAWIITIAKNLAINDYHKYIRESAVDFQVNPSLAAEEFDATKNWLFETAKKHLDEEELEILLLAAVYGYKRREISEMKDIPVSTVSWKYKRAAEKLKEIVGREQNL